MLCKQHVPLFTINSSMSTDPPLLQMQAVIPSNCNPIQPQQQWWLWWEGAVADGHGELASMFMTLPKLK